MAQSARTLSVWARFPRSGRQVVAQIATTQAVGGLFEVLTGKRLRILAYHGVDDLARFKEQVREILRGHTPVTGDDILAGLNGEAALPDRPVWFTFDDGLRSTFEAGEVLASHGVRATAFVCPATLAQPGLLWFQTHAFAERQGLIGLDEQEHFSLRRMKTIPDRLRRDATAELEARIKATLSPQSLTGTPADLRAWIALGHEIGNHTWDHPCLDQCDPEEQREQIFKAHAWLREQGICPRFFAYPNGDWTPGAAKVADELGYAGSLLFDHRLSRLYDDPHRISRLRIDAGADSRRTAAIMSGAHSTLFTPLSMLRRPRVPSRRWIARRAPTPGTP